MARYQKVLPMVDSQANTFNQIHQYMTGQGFKYEPENGQPAFRKGDGFWAASRHLVVTYYGNFVRVEAWIDNLGTEMGLEGFYGWAVKGPLKKNVEQVEQILTRPGVGFVPQAQPQPQPQTVPQVQAQPQVQPQPVAPAQNAQFCGKCGTPLQPGGKFCPKCGNVIGAPAIPASGPALPPGTTKKEYIKNYAGESFRRALRNTAIIGYVCAGINAVVSVLVSPLGLIDSAILLGLTLGMHLGKSKGCAIGMLAYSIFSTVLGLVLYGSVTGWLWIAAGVSAVMVFVNAEKRYKELMGIR